MKFLHSFTQSAEKRRAGKNICFLMAIILSACLVVPAYATTKSEVQENLDSLEDDKAKLEAYLESLESLKADTEAYIAQIDDKMSEYAAEISDLLVSQADLEDQIEETEEKLAEAEEDIVEQYETMKLRIQYNYENGNRQFLELILESESISDFLNKAEYISQISEYDRNMLTKMQDTKALIEEAKVTLEEQKAELEDVIAQAEAKQEELEILREAKSEELSSYQTSISNTQSEIEDVAEEIQDEEKLLAEIEAIEKKRAEEAAAKAKEEAQKATANGGGSTSTGTGSGTGSTVTTSSGGFIWPLPGYHRISSDYGYRNHPISGTYKLHSGMDLPAPAGTSIIASASGEVAWASYSSSAGNWIGIDHGNGVYTVYMHCSKLLVSAGQKVSQGDKIALVGTTGSSTGNHLHFGVRVNGSYVNPHNYVGY